MICWRSVFSKGFNQFGGVKIRLRKKILFIKKDSEISGPTSYLLDITKGLKESNSVSILFFKEGPLLNSFGKTNINFLIKPEIFKNPFEHCEFFSQYDLAILNSIPTFRLSAAIKKSGVPIIWEIHGMKRKSLKENGIKKYHFRLPDKIIFVSNVSRKSFADFEQRKNFMTGNYGINVSDIKKFIQENNKRKIREKWGYSPNDIIISTIGRINKSKGQLDFIQAASKIILKYPKVKFLIVGPGKKEFIQKIQRLILLNGLSSNVQILPPPENIYEIFYITDFFVSCSLFESLGRAILEAMAFELPIVSTDSGGPSELLSNKSNGILVPPNNPVLLAQKLELLLKNPEILTKDIRRNKWFVRKFFDLAKSIQSYQILINQISKRDLI